MTGIIILAAGASSRLGRAKQTLVYQNKTLLERAIYSAINAEVGPVLVVIGANQTEVQAEVKNKDVQIVLNQDWKDGMSSSIRAGIVALLKHWPQAENVILMVCDQPYVNEQVLKNLVNTRNTTNKPLVACWYNETVGVPALFSRQLFSELESLTGEAGGKSILLKNLSDVATLPFELGVVDIDTVRDYEDLQNGQS